MKRLMVFLISLMIVSNLIAQNNTIDLIVESSESILPDLLVISIDLKYKAKKEQEVIDQFNQNLDRQISIIESAGFKREQIKLSDFKVDELRDWDSKIMKILGYEATQTIKIKIPLIEKGLIGKLLEALNLNKNDNIQINVTAELSDDLQKQVKNRVIIKALNDAKEKAEIMAKTMQLTLGKVKSIEYGDLFFRPMLKKSIRFTPPVVDESENTKVRSTSYDILGFSETEIRDKVHVMWNIE